MESEIRELDHKREQNKEELFEKEIESEDQQNKLTHYKELYDGFFYLVTMLREKQKKLLRSKGILRKLVQECEKEESKKDEADDLNEYLFNLEEGEATPQVAKKPCNSTNFYQNQRPARRGNPNWTTKSTSSKKKWEEAWKEARRQQDLQIILKLIQRSSISEYEADKQTSDQVMKKKDEYIKR
ncbi:hypothetical protein GCK72_026111 [Caenorhabditis remanei]|uniref:Uncharacterized protein n=1 Tax=Caenorhabditis remanei TaxID=31234 RepID=A0A6A5G4A6_CAERE|nr:hypothetical protein GCK72_026111 [Caenorhabditis remanei]KAF1749643.1 hypothetical protein GCK72_026111 [Caenorhabditis remanei]